MYSKKILKDYDQKRFNSREWNAADLHIHTNCSYDALPSPTLDPLFLYEKARRKNFNFVTFTDHDTMSAFDKIGWQREHLVPGVEIKIRDVRMVGHTLHVNVYLLTKNQFGEILDIARGKKSLELFLQYLQENNLPYVYNHPFWFEPGEKPSLQVISDLAKIFPVLEYNMHRVGKKNKITLALAEKNGKGIVATTDSHVGFIGRALTIAQGKDFREYFDNITRGNAYLVAKDLSVKLLKDEIAVWLDLIFHSKKFAIDKTHLVNKRPIKRLFKIPLTRKMHNVPKIQKATGYMLSKVAKSGAPAFLYVTSQNLKARRINRILSRTEGYAIKPSGMSGSGKKDTTASSEDQISGRTLIP